MFKLDHKRLVAVLAAGLIGLAIAPVTEAAPKKPAGRMTAGPAKKKATKPAPPKPQRPLVSATGTLVRADLLGLGLIAMREMPKDADPFKAGPTAKFAGRRFILAQALKPDGENNLTTDATWSYSRTTRSLTLRVSGPYHVYFNSTSRGSHIAQTRMGVKFRVSTWDETSIVLSDSGSTVPYGGLSLVIEADGEEARRLSQDVVVVIEGYLVAGEEDATAGCESGYENASLDDPDEIVELKCTIHVVVDHLAFVDSRDRRVLKELGGRPGPTEAEATPQAAASAASTATDDTLQDPDFARRPNGDDYARYYPERAARLEKSGSVRLSCVVSSTGTMVDCKILSEDPPDYGFGDASLKIVKLFKVNPKAGAPLEGKVWTTTLHWKLPKE